MAARLYNSALFALTTNLHFFIHTIRAICCCFLMYRLLLYIKIGI